MLTLYYSYISEVVNMHHIPLMAAIPRQFSASWFPWEVKHSLLMELENTAESFLFPTPQKHLKANSEDGRDINGTDGIIE